MAEIDFAHVSKAFSGKQVLRDFSETVKTGECVLLKGPSGCGKTTLLRMAAGLLLPDEGRVTRGGESVSYVFQEDRLIEFLPAIKNVLLVCKTQRQRDSAAGLLARLGLSAMDRKPVSAYSGGMKRRVAIARGLVVAPDVLLLDEPFTGLDEENRAKAAALLREGKEGRVTLLVSHDAQDGARMQADRVIEMG